jgi:hypothetical protein
MQELSLLPKCVLLASATLMIGFSTLARCRGSDVNAAATIQNTSPDTLSPGTLNFITWPKPSFATADAPFVLGIVGTPSSVGHRDMLDKYATHNRLIQGRRVKVVRFESAKTIQKCHLLFISRACSAEETRAALQQVQGQPVLTVGESHGFALSGGVMNFTPTKGCAFEINPLAAERQQLKIDGRLEALAKIIEEP